MKPVDKSHPPENAVPSDARPWQLPAWNKKGKVVKSADREAREHARAGKKEIVEDVSRKPKPKPLTAEQLKKIADQAQQEGYADGFKEGMEKGIAQGEQTGQKHGEAKAYQETRNRYENEITRLKAIADRLLQPMQQQDEQLENAIVQMAINLAEKLILSELQIDPGKIIGVVNKALAELPVGAKNICVQVAPQDAELLEQLIPASHRHWRVEENTELQPGGCKIITADSLVDFSIASRLQNYLDEAAEAAAENDENGD
ncbi:flagellar assembly protein FliH [Alteromonadaceae bacterium 2753L.S.0a.02]|nr:flagellar assembly protein FliH [Alteromonadaceae bacterium 2753L.S.0a.02]